MENTNNLKDSRTLAREAVKLLLEKKGSKVRLFDIRGMEGITDFYVNVSGRSSTQVAALAGDLEERISELGREPLHVEGRSGNAWILVDYGDVIINVFDKPSREFYDFDRHLPAECEVGIEDLVEEVDKKFEL